MWVREGRLDKKVWFKWMDGGCAKITDFVPDGTQEEDEGFFLRFHSWSFKHLYDIWQCRTLKEDEFPFYLDHSEFNQFVGKRLRVTIEVLEEPDEDAEKVEVAEKEEEVHCSRK